MNCMCTLADAHCLGTTERGGPQNRHGAAGGAGALMGFGVPSCNPHSPSGTKKATKAARPSTASSSAKAAPASRRTSTPEPIQKKGKPKRAPKGASSPTSGTQRPKAKKAKSSAASHITADAHASSSNIDVHASYGAYAGSGAHANSGARADYVVHADSGVCADQEGRSDYSAYVDYGIPEEISTNAGYPRPDDMEYAASSIGRPQPGDVAAESLGDMLRSSPLEDAAEVTNGPPSALDGIATEFVSSFNADPQTDRSDPVSSDTIKSDGSVGTFRRLPLLGLGSSTFPVYNPSTAIHLPLRASGADAVVSMDGSTSSVSMSSVPQVSTAGAVSSLPVREWEDTAYPPPAAYPPAAGVPAHPPPAGPPAQPPAAPPTHLPPAGPPAHPLPAGPPTDPPPAGPPTHPLPAAPPAHPPPAGPPAHPPQPGMPAYSLSAGVPTISPPEKIVIEPVDSTEVSSPKHKASEEPRCDPSPDPWLEACAQTRVKRAQACAVLGGKCA